ncbi:DNA polymerase III subunit gamma/tau [Candidatus Saccharibacteria bacterium]|nr:DNA polymerase III subunit gamma/tau [Candidatus Saccharibacteria bacterium]
MKALYRKYRPKTLAEVVGQAQVTTPLEKSLKDNKISHSYLFTGPRGTGKTSVARILAHEVNHFPYELEDSYLDIIEIDAASNTGVDNIRDLREKAAIAPSKGNYKVYIIDEVHMLSKSAFNALLKTLEEPPEHVVFILATTDLEKVPITITSRSQVFTFRLSAPDTMLSHLKKICEQEKINIDESALNLIISRGGGSFRDTLSLLDQISVLGSKTETITEQIVADTLGLPLDSKSSALLEAYSKGNTEGITKLLKELISEGIKPELIAESLLKKIISAPSFDTLDLLETLPSVSAPFPEAKLLLALLSNAKKNFEPASEPPSTSPKIIKKEPIIAKKESIASSKNDNSKPTNTIKPDEPEKPEQTKTPKSPEPPSDPLTNNAPKNAEADTSKNPSKSSDFSWPTFLETIHTANPALFQQLQKCQYKSTKNSLDLYPLKKITKIILKKPTNYSILLENLPKDFELTVHDLDELEKDPKIKKITDIMGGGDPLDTNSSPF